VGIHPECQRDEDGRTLHPFIPLSGSDLGRLIGGRVAGEQKTDISARRRAFRSRLPFTFFVNEVCASRQTIHIRSFVQDADLERTSAYVSFLFACYSTPCETDRSTSYAFFRMNLSYRLWRMSVTAMRSAMLRSYWSYCPVWPVMNLSNRAPTRVQTWARGFSCPSGINQPRPRDVAATCCCGGRHGPPAS
jgi:hypothetical protein